MTENSIADVKKLSCLVTQLSSQTSRESTGHFLAGLPQPPAAESLQGVLLASPEAPLLPANLPQLWLQVREEGLCSGPYEATGLE
ncbi:hypothetical protein GN956_G10301 [Arapaima gigas]